MTIRYQVEQMVAVIKTLLITNTKQTLLVLIGLYAQHWLKAYTYLKMS